MATAKTKAETVQMIPLAELMPDPNNPRTSYPEEPLAELAESIKTQGVIEPLIVRPIIKGQPSCLIVAGHRRYYASLRAMIDAIPCVVRDLTDTQAEDIQIHENLHRADLEPLDEADAFARLRAKGESIEQIAQRAGKGTTYVAKRLKFADVMPELRADCKVGLVPLSFVFEFAKYPEDTQKLLYEGMYEVEEGAMVHPENPELVWNEEFEVYSDFEDFDKLDENFEFDTNEEVEEFEAKLEAYKDRDLPEPVPTKEGVRTLQWSHANEITRVVNNQLKKRLDRMPWDLDDTALRADGLACSSCPLRSGINAGLFDEGDDPDCCLDPDCHHAKTVKFIQITREAIAEKKKIKPEEVPMIYADYYDRNKDWPEDFSFNVQKNYQDHEIKNEADRCEQMTEMVRSDGHMGGICYHVTGCKQHHGRSSYSYSESGSSSSKGGEKTDAEKKIFLDRKEELFDVKIGEAVRVEVIAQAAEYFSKNGLGVLSEFTDHATARLWANVDFTQTRSFETFCKAANLELPSVSSSWKNQHVHIEALASLTQEQKAKLLIILSHYWDGDMRNKRYESQAGIRAVAERFEVNYRLIDAQKRVENSTKKTEKTFKAYLQQCEVNDPGAKLPRIWSPDYIAPDLRPKVETKATEPEDLDDEGDAFGEAEPLTGEVGTVGTLNECESCGEVVPEGVEVCDYCQDEEPEPTTDEIYEELKADFSPEAIYEKAGAVLGTPKAVEPKQANIFDKVIIARPAGSQEPECKLCYGSVEAHDVGCPNEAKDDLADITDELNAAFDEALGD